MFHLFNRGTNKKVMQLSNIKLASSVGDYFIEGLVC